MLMELPNPHPRQLTRAKPLRDNIHLQPLYRNLNPRMGSDMEPNTKAAFKNFPRTSKIWWLVEQVKAGKERRESLDVLLRLYVPPLLAHLIVAKKLPAQTAEDLVQDFVESKILRLRLIERADRRLGRFRSFLLTTLDRFLIDHYRKKDEPVQALGETQVEMPEDNDESEPFNIAWVRQVIDAAAAEMQAECAATGRLDVWGVFEKRMLNPLYGREPASYESLVADFHFKSPSQAQNVLVTAKRSFERALREVIAEYSVDEKESEQELEALKRLIDKA
jgi:DNA-directed RNA polymerase specialized sigma24 family protein